MILAVRLSAANAGDNKPFIIDDQMRYCNCNSGTLVMFNQIDCQLYLGFSSQVDKRE
jgi:hypothetical protein